MTPLYIFDLDGTLADLRHRLHHVRLLPGSKVKVDGRPAVFLHANTNASPQHYLVDFGGGTEPYYVDERTVRLVKDWDAFHAACVDDKPIAPVIDLLCSLYWDADAAVRVWSGRTDTVRQQTVAWLDKHVMSMRYMDADALLKMRPAGDDTPDDQLKESWLKALSPEDRARLVMVFDDRQRVVDMWRRNGVTCAQVAEGDF